jgi:hypothetical protein
MHEPEPINAESDLDVVIKAAEIAEKVIDTEVKESAEKIRGTWAEQFMALSPSKALDEFYRYHPPSLHDKDVIPPGGPPKPGGGSKSKRRKKPVRRIPEYMKRLGM